MQGFVGVRDADVLGVWSPNTKNAAASATYARELGVGDAQAYRSIRDMVADPRIDALWLCGPNQARISNMEEIVATIRDGGGKLRGLACEKPLARNVAEAKTVARLAKSVGLNTRFAMAAGSSEVSLVRSRSHETSPKQKRSRDSRRVSV